MSKFIKIWLPALLAMLLLSGCGMKTVDQLYCLPKRSEADNDLVAVINEAMEGLSFSTPVYGENRLTVQAADLDGDNVDEYLVFARDNSEKPLKILIFCQLASGYVLMDTIEGFGLSFDFVEYAQVDDRPGVEIIVGRQVNDRVARSVSVYRFSNGVSRQLLTTGYSRLSTCDLDEDGQKELFILNYGTADNGNGLVNVFKYTDGELKRTAEQSISSNSLGFERFTEGRLHDGRKAVFVTCEGEDQELVTDIFIMEAGILHPVANGVISPSLQGYSVFPWDVDGDGVLEMARTVTVPSAEAARQTQLLQWYSLDSAGNETMKQCTFHTYDEGWFLEIPKEYLTRISIEPMEDATRFCLLEGKRQILMFTMRALTGADKEAEAKLEGRVVLYKGDAVIYTVEITEEAEDMQITADIISNVFHPIRAELMTEED